MPTQPSDRAARIAVNETRFREINRRLADDLDSVVGDPEHELLDFVCECGTPSCTHPLRLTLAEYARVHDDPMCFVVRAGHEFPDVEEVVGSEDRFRVVRKFEQSRPFVA